MAEQTKIVSSSPIRPAPLRPGQEAAITPKEIFQIIRRHILLIVSFTVLGFVLAVGAWFLLKKYAPKYTASTLIRVLSPVERDPYVISSGTVGKDIQYGYRLSMASLINQQSMLEDLLKKDKVQQTRWFQNFGDIMDVRFQKAYDNLKNNLSVRAERDAEFVRVAMTCRDKYEAALIVNEMVELFLDSRGITSKAEVTSKLANLDAQRDRVQESLNFAERALDEIRRATGFTDLEKKNFRDTIDYKLGDLDVQQNELQMTISQLQSNVGRLETLAAGPITNQVAQLVETDPTNIMLTREIFGLQSALAGRRTRFGENHRVIQQAKELINATEDEKQQRRIEIANQTRQANLQNARDNLIVLQSRLEELNRLRQETTLAKADLDRARTQYENAVLVKDERKTALDTIKEQIDKWRVKLDEAETAKVQAVGPALPPLTISSPRWQMYFPGGTILGLIAGAALAFLMELLNDLVRTARDVARYLNIPLLGIIPHADQDDLAREVDLCSVLRQAPFSILSESYRRLRTNYKLSEAAVSAKSLLVTSGMAGDGKTSVAVNLATAFVAENKKVLLIDANFRRPSFAKIFPQQQLLPQLDKAGPVGLSSLLVGACTWADAKRANVIDGLDIIESGPAPTNPTELLGTDQMRKLISQTRDSYDYVIIDSPPVLVVSDAQVLAGVVDATILVFNANTTRRGAAQRTIRELRQVDARIAGCVLFAVRALKGGYFTEQFRSYRKYQTIQLAHAT